MFVSFFVTVFLCVKSGGGKFQGNPDTLQVCNLLPLVAGAIVAALLADPVDIVTTTSLPVPTLSVCLLTIVMVMILLVTKKLSLIPGRQNKGFSFKITSDASNCGLSELID